MGMSRRAFAATLVCAALAHAAASGPTVFDLEEIVRQAIRLADALLAGLEEPPPARP
jgi:hypothetical protein